MELHERCEIDRVQLFEVEQNFLKFDCSEKSISVGILANFSAWICGASGFRARKFSFSCCLHDALYEERRGYRQC